MTSIEEQPKPAEAGSTQDAKKHFVRNTGASLLYFAFNALTSLYFIKFQLRYLGEDGYGIVGTANAFVSYLQVLSFALLGTTFRFVTMNLARGDREEADGYASTHLATLFYSIIALLPICAVVSYLTPALLRRIPSEQIMNTRILFLLVYLNFMVALGATPYQLATYLKQRFDIRNLLDAVNQVFRYSIWVVLFAIAVPRLWYIGVGYLIGSSIALTATIVVSRRLAPDFRPSIRRFSRAKLAEMAKMGGWVGLDTFGNMLYWSTDLLVIIRMLGPADAGRYNVACGFAVMLRSVVAMMGTMIAPTTVAAYARQEWDALRTNMARSVKFMGLGLALMLGVLCGLCTPFIAWWLGKEIPDPAVLKMLGVLMWIMVAPLVLNSALEPLNALLLATNRLAIPCVATIISALLKIAISVLLIRSTDLGVVAVAIAGLITFTLRQLAFGPIYASRILSTSAGPLYRAILPGAVVFAGVASSTLWLAGKLDLSTLPRLAGVGMLVFALGAVATYFLALNNTDRRFLREVAPGKKKA